MRFCSITLFCLLCGNFTAHAQESRPKIAIKTFENPANFSRSSIGNGLTDILTTELQNTGKFNVLERGNIDELTKEMDFGNSEYSKSSSFAQKGHILGAQYLLMGKVTNFSYSEHAEMRQKVSIIGPNRVEQVFQQRADVRVDFRLIDVSTGETVISQPGEAHKTNTSLVSEVDSWYRCTTTGSITAEASSTLIGKATTEAVKDVVRKLNTLSNTVRERGAGAAMTADIDNLSNAKGQVVAEEGGGLWIIGGIGSANGVRKGDHLKLAHENMIKDKTGRVVYRKSIEIGAMEITDVSQADHAEAKFLSSSSAGSSIPQANDLVTVDVDYAKTLRGSSSRVSTTPSTSSQPASTSVNSAKLDGILKRADNYMMDKFWSQALDEYKQAAAISPNDPHALQGEALSQFIIGDFIEAEEPAEKLLQNGGAFSIPIAHYHSMGLCTGQLTLQKGKLTYVSEKGDGFDLTPAHSAHVEIKKLSHGFVVNEKTPDWPIIEVVWRDAGNHEKKYQLLPTVYGKQPLKKLTNLASAFPMDDGDVHQLQKLEYSLFTLIQKYYK